MAGTIASRRHSTSVGRIILFSHIREGVGLLVWDDAPQISMGMRGDRGGRSVGAKGTTGGSLGSPICILVGIVAEFSDADSWLPCWSLIACDSTIYSQMQRVRWVSVYWVAAIRISLSRSSCMAGGWSSGTWEGDANMPGGNRRMASEGVAVDAEA